MKLCRILPVVVMLSLAGSAQSAPKPPGPYWVNGPLCGEDDCDNIPGRWRALNMVDLRAKPLPEAPVIAHLAAGEWVKAQEKRTKVFPLRGKVRFAGGGLSAGDLVYGPMPGSDDDHEVIWTKGRTLRLTLDPDSSQIDWVSPPDGRLMKVMWVRIESTNGVSGWLLDPQDFACMGMNPGEDEHCAD
ncbi:MAG: hypothetical protein WCO83_09840 [Alphaproteobacteria bacterium]